ncbi:MULTISPECIES: molybdate ABC transporter permease subunit [unclassified Campylobacter]|uniref:molybdate ABC transporter permease subunit n=1 Tax=unclassified Campylobacter TaxID=2593542 RepID=UPI001237C058|nr:MULTISPECIES: molybdate ABC transporter permease subunit [unclassified Campylobacter]KAA6226473.1 molybdate ABC transporter permease subunit [Campylobacter sp. LR185c]KAA6228608.1 molybdate ABC transporter permease subunit [Campylobacter sp. LR196d]KAA6229161.1 molybdate ABC transporter permease subunit [Campylobacter sp. LR286c]KAA6233952.1 molybdate ABC transporter permease subunit [Campylobacter sp. LR291e]KAA6234191.1 molybdate ABC transporter permease subunit [Campylobacter sp. LR264d]
MFLDSAFLETLWLTFKLSFITTFLLFFVGIFCAYFFVFVRFPLKPIFQVIVAMPLVLPPSVLGFYLLVTFSANSTVGQFLKEYFNLTLVFTFEGLVFASMLFSLPFMVNPLQSAFASVSKNLIDASYTLGKGKIATLFRVIIPNSKVGIFTGCVMAFAHTVGEFGVVMMIGGHKKGETLVASIAIYDELEALNYTLAHHYAFVLFALSFIILLSLYFVNKKFTY